MALKPWYNLITPRKDVRKWRPRHASEFAVHLDQVRDGRAPQDHPTLPRDPDFEPIVLVDVDQGDIPVVAELIEVLP